MTMKIQNWLRVLRNARTFIIYLRNMYVRHVTMKVRSYLRLRFACRLCSCLGAFLASVQRATNLSQWLNGKRHAIPFVVPMVWREPSNHATDCYFCTVLPVSGGITKKKKWTIVYPNIPSALRQAPHGEVIPVPEPPKEFSIDSEDEDEGESTSGSPEPPASTEPHVY